MTSEDCQVDKDYSSPKVVPLPCYRATLSKTCTDLSMSSEPYTGLPFRRGSNRRFTRSVRSSANERAAGQEKEMRGSLCGAVIGRSFCRE